MIIETMKDNSERSSTIINAQTSREIELQKQTIITKLSSNYSYPPISTLTTSQNEAIKFSLSQCKADPHDCELGINKFFESLTLFLAVSTQQGNYFDSKLLAFLASFLQPLLLHGISSSQNIETKRTNLNEAKFRNEISFFKAKLIVHEQFISQKVFTQGP